MNQPLDKVSVKLFKNTGITAAPSDVQEVSVNDDANEWVSVHLEKDFFVEADGCTIVIEDNRAAKYNSYLQRGYRIQVLINDKVQFDGFIFDYKYTYSRNTTSITLQCKDLLEFMAQGSIPPNFEGTLNGSLLTNYHFPPNATLLQCLQAIITMFQIGLVDQVPTLQQLYLTTNDNGGQAVSNKNTSQINVNFLDIASGFAAGLRVTGKKAAPLTKSWNNALNRYNTPDAGESYLSMMKRLVKLSGGYIKMAPGSANTIVVQAPTYDRVTPSPLWITHYTSNNLGDNNVSEATLHFSLDQQHSVIIMEGNSLDQNEFHLTDAKAVAVNELSGFLINNTASTNNIGSGAIQPVNSVAQFINALVPVPNNQTVLNVADGKPLQGTNYTFKPFNDQLYQLRANLPVDIKTAMCLPLYDTSHNAHNLAELLFAASQKLSEEQDKAVEFTYKIPGLSYQGHVWQPNMMVNVAEEALTPGSPAIFSLWIKKVVYHQDRHQGTWTEITCTLPYTHNYELTDTPVNVAVPSQKPELSKAVLDIFRYLDTHPHIYIDATMTPVPPESF